ncbi:hypothetical protein [Desulfogranum mediterraneum]|uniref:hypothetical protein n=1 Tax=Desulfogranum mediterraneum TaxID=160661 RepID=UPI0004146F44|nr:hypothetical protein [Desulfogranum mediterraneum]
MTRLFSRQPQLETLTKVCRNSYLTSCVQAIVYGSFLTILLQSWQTGTAFFLLESFSEETVKFVRSWITFGYILTMLHFFITLEQIPKYLEVLQSDNPKYDLKRHLDCVRWLGVVCGFTAGMLISFSELHPSTGSDSRLIWSIVLLMLIMMFGVGRDFWRMSGLSPGIARKIEHLSQRYAVARSFCLEIVEHRPFVDVDFDLLTQELRRQAAA